MKKKFGSVIRNFGIVAITAMILTGCSTKAENKTVSEPAKAVMEDVDCSVEKMDQIEKSENSEMVEVSYRMGEDEKKVCLSVQYDDNGRIRALAPVQQHVK